jgi:hypothetical protein
MLLVEGLAEFGHHRVIVETLDGPDVDSVARDRESDAGSLGLAVDEHSAGAADPVLAAQVRPCQPFVFAQIVGQGQSRLDPRRNFPAIQVQRHIIHRANVLATARLIATA